MWEARGLDFSEMAGRTNGPIGHKKVPKRINIQDGRMLIRDASERGHIPKCS